MVTHSSVLAWRIPESEEPGGLAIYGVAQSRTQLKQLSSSSSSPYNEKDMTVQIKTTMRCQLTPLRMAIIKQTNKQNLQIINAGQSAVKREPSYTTGANVN